MTAKRQTAEQDYRAAARRLGCGEGLIARIESLRVPPSVLDSWLRWNPSAERVAQAADRYEQATFGSLRQREATGFDNEKLADLFASTPEEVGGWEVTAERSPYAFAQFRLQENVQVQVLEEAGVLVAVISRSTRNALVGGVRLNVRFSSAARVRPSGRGRGLSLYVRYASPACVPYPNADYWYFRSQNFDARQWLRRADPGRLSDAPPREDDVPGIAVTVQHYPSAPAAGDTTGIRRVRPGDVPACVDLINRTHHGQDLFRPYTVDFFEHRMNDGGWGPKPDWWVRVYGWDDHWVVEDAGRVVACAGLWDRGRHLRERWRHRETGEERVLEPAALLDLGYADGRADAMARLIEHLVGQTHDLGRTHLMAPLQQLPEVAARLDHLQPAAETWSMQWEYFPPDDSGLPERLPITRPYTDLVYW